MRGSLESTRTILIVDDLPTNIDVLAACLGENGFDVSVARDGETALSQITQVRPDLILLDVMMPGMNGFETCRRLKEMSDAKDIPVIFMTSLSDTLDKVKGFDAGAVDYVTKPLHHDEVLVRVQTHLKIRSLQSRLEEANSTLEQRVEERTQELQQALLELEQAKSRLQVENLYLQEVAAEVHAFDQLVGNSQAINTVRRHIDLVASTNSTVLILGESGTGKELVAREIHQQSLRKDRSMIRVNCASIPRELYESEFFGHVKGAFTGAVKDRVGRFEAADGGTLFLDEVGEIPLELQSKFLRVLQDQQYERVGEEKTRRVDVRIIAATNRDLTQEVKAGRFRQDLYFRLNVYPIEIPALRRRKEDIPLLAGHLLQLAAKKLNCAVPPVTEAQLGTLQHYDWPGNVRELQNVIERAVITSRQDNTLHFDFLGQRGGTDVGEPLTSVEEKSSRKILTEQELQQLEHNNLLAALEATGWKIYGPGGAAELLGVNPKTMISRVQKIGLKKPEAAD